MSRSTKLILTVVWVLAAAALWGLWDVVRPSVLRALLPHVYGSNGQAEAVALKMAAVITLVKFLVVLGPVWAIWHHQGPSQIAQRRRVESSIGELRDQDRKRRANNWAALLSTLVLAVSLVAFMSAGFDFMHSLIGATVLAAVCWGGTYSVALRAKRLA